MKRFDAREFLGALIEDCASSERNEEQFVADPSKLGPLLQSTSREFTLLTLRYEALAKHFWQVRRSEDSKWRVYSAEVSSEVADGQEAGFGSPEEALDEAILRYMLASPRGLQGHPTASG